jgi:EAL domain-containing protein (putative c-di-GMP-specific phosphodiesterase class I)
MSSTTTADVTPRLLLDSPAAVDVGVHAGVDARALNAGLCSPAGLHRRPWLARLRRALDSGLFVLHFQPIVALSDRSVSHHEALLRLADEPDGLIREIDRIVLDEVVAALAAESSAPLGGAAVAEASPPARLAVNLSALSVTDPSMLAYVQQRLAWYEVDPARLVIEVTETAAISDMARAKSFCAGVLALGCEVALDDFGVGFGSFQYLKHLPFTYLKIDGDFIRLLPVSRTDQLVVRALAGVVRGMGRRTIAEFVGDEMTISMLRSYGVDYAQGFAVGHPSPDLVADR